MRREIHSGLQVVENWNSGNQVVFYGKDGDLIGADGPVLPRVTCRSSSYGIDAVFPTRNGTWLQANKVERLWRQVRKEAGLEWVTPNAFRRDSWPSM